MRKLKNLEQPSKQDSSWISCRCSRRRGRPGYINCDHAFKAHDFDASNYAALNDQLGGIALKMGMVDTHLGNITAAFGDIEQHLKSSLKAKEKVMAVTDETKRKKTIRKA